VQDSSENHRSRHKSNRREYQYRKNREVGESDYDTDEEVENPQKGLSSRLVAREERCNLDHLEMTDQDNIDTTEELKKKLEWQEMMSMKVARNYCDI